MASSIAAAITPRTGERRLPILTGRILTGVGGAGAPMTIGGLGGLCSASGSPVDGGCPAEVRVTE
jgi:hypothetical protein